MRELYARGKRALAKGADALESKLDAVERHTAVRAAIFFCVLALIGGTMYLLNVHTPLNVDDYDFMYSWATGDFLSGVADVIRSQRVYYSAWGGRSINHANLQLMMYLGKDVYNVVNTAVYLLLLLEIYAIARLNKPEGRFDWLLLTVSHLALFTMIPFFGFICLWATGACNYLWGTVLALMPILLLRSVREGGWFAKNRVLGVLCVPLGLIAGWTNENTSLAVIAMVLAALAVDALEGRRIPKRLIGMVIAQCVGAVIMLVAPGNGTRADTLETGSLIVELVKRFVLVTGYGASYVGALFAAVLVLMYALRGKGARISHACLLLFGALAAAYAMLGSPVLSERTFTGAFVMVLAAGMLLLAELPRLVRGIGAARLVILPALMVVMVYTGYHAIKDVKAYETEWNAVVDTIETAVASGQEEVVVPSVKSHSRFTVDTLIEKDPTLWPNKTMEKYYGIRIVGQ